MTLHTGYVLSFIREEPLTVEARVDKKYNSSCKEGD